MSKDDNSNNSLSFPSQKYRSVILIHLCVGINEIVVYIIPKLIICFDSNVVQ